MICPICPRATLAQNWVYLMTQTPQVLFLKLIQEIILFPKTLDTIKDGTYFTIYLLSILVFLQNVKLKRLCLSLFLDAINE